MTPSTKLWMIVGPSGTGKTTLVKKLVADGYMLEAISHTTRAIRPGEVDGVDYHYIDRPRFNQMLADGEFLENVEYNGNLYGVSRAEIDQKLTQDNVVIIVEGHGAEQLKAHYGDRARTLFLLPPSMDELRRRLTARKGSTPEIVETRLASVAAEMEFEYLADVKIGPGTIGYTYLLAFSAMILNISTYPEIPLTGFWDTMREWAAIRLSTLPLVRKLLGGHWERWMPDAPLGGPKWVRTVKCYHETGIEPAPMLRNLMECETHDHQHHPRYEHRPC